MQRTLQGLATRKAPQGEGACGVERSGGHGRGCLRVLFCSLTLRCDAGGGASKRPPVPLTVERSSWPVQSVKRGAETAAQGLCGVAPKQGWTRWRSGRIDRAIGPGFTGPNVLDGTGA